LTDSETLYAVNPDGSEKWSPELFAGNASGSIAIGTDNTIYVQDADTLYAVNPDGSVKWTSSVTGYGGYITIAEDGTIYLATELQLYALNPADGSEEWSFTDDTWLSGPAIGEDGTIYLSGCTDDWMTGYLYALNPADGSEEWSFTAGPMGCAPVIGADGTIYVGDTSADWTSGTIYALDPADGTEKWSYATDYPVFGSPAIGADGTLYVPSGLDAGSKLYAFEGPPATASSSLNATTNIVMPTLGIEIDRDSIDYGDIAPGESSAVETVGITNTGTLDCDVTLEVDGVDATAQEFYEQSLYIDGALYDMATIIASIEAGLSDSVDTQLQVPLSWAEPGVQEATFIFWAEATP
jgi:hypothetical protein